MFYIRLGALIITGKQYRIDLQSKESSPNSLKSIALLRNVTMDNENKISQYRERLDKTLTSPNLTSEKAIKSLIKKQLFHSAKHENEGEIESILGLKTKEVKNTLDMLRSASGNVYESSKGGHDSSHTQWKLKQDSKEIRVMYREGPQGTPFHSLLAEGYIDGPMDASLCVSWESTLYKKWWPQYNVPAFKVLSCQCLQKVRVCEHISLVRLKVPWPLSTREALMHYFAFEYFQENLIIILINTISDLKSIDKSTHGFTTDGIPDAVDTVRFDVVGGIALQKVTQERSFFRTIANVDIKLDFVPPTLINFISRQLIGSGFKLYQKAVASVAKSDEDFNKALSDPIYARIRNALYSDDMVDEFIEILDLKLEQQCVPPKEHPPEIIENGDTKKDHMVHVKETTVPFTVETSPNKNPKFLNEIEEEGEEKEQELEESVQDEDQFHVKRKFCPSPEVKRAIGTLEKVISMIRKQGLNDQTRPLSDLTIGYPKLDSIVEASVAEVREKFFDSPAKCSNVGNSRHVELSSNMSKTSFNVIATKFPEQDLQITNIITEAPTPEKILTYSNKKVNFEVNDTHETKLSQRKKLDKRKNYRLCCFYSNAEKS